MALASFALACDPAIEQPTLVDLGGTLAAYEAPRGVLTSENVGALVAEAAPRLRGLALANPQQLLAAVVSDLGSELESRGIVSSDASARSTLSIDARIRLRAACPGSESYQLGGDPAFGSLDLTTRVDDNVLAHVIQGHAYACEFPVAMVSGPEPGEPSDVPVSALDGDVFLYRYDALTTPIEQARFLFVVDGTLSTGAAGGTLLDDFDARLLGPVVETRLAVSGAEVVAFLDGETLGIRDAENRYTCELQARVCRDADGRPIAW